MSGEAWELHPDFLAASVAVAELELCQVRLQDDARFPWLILVPRLPGAVEMTDLPPDRQAALMAETTRAAGAVRALGEAAGRPVAKLNVAALGNVTPQLHLHVIGRRRDDAAWPKPVWGQGEARPYEEQARRDAVRLARERLSPRGS